jgi:nitrogen regulatory protein P-II 1
VKLVIAYIQPERLNDVKNALHKRDITRMSVTNALGCGSQLGYQESYRGAETEINLLKKVRVEIAVNDDFVRPTIDAIIEGARTESIGDGKIFILPIEECIRIRTLEEGEGAIGG